MSKTENLHIQMRNQFALLKYFMDSFLALDKAFNYNFGQERKIDGLPYFAFRDRFLFDATESFKSSIDNSINSFLETLLAEEDDFHLNVKQEFEKTAKHILDVLSDKTNKLIDCPIQKKRRKMEFLLGELDQLKEYLVADVGEFQNELRRFETKFGGGAEPSGERASGEKEDRGYDEDKELREKLAKMVRLQTESNKKLDLVYKMSLFEERMNVESYKLDVQGTGKWFVISR
jgi:hypothetical protein